MNGPTEASDERATGLLLEANARTSVAFREPPGLEEPHAMRTLGLVLTSDASPRARPPKTPRPPRPPRGRRVATLAAPAAGAVGVGIALALTLHGGSNVALADKFPIFAAPSVQPARGALTVFREDDVQPGSSRAISTPHGTAYVSASRHDRQLCLATPPIEGAQLLRLARQAEPTETGQHGHFRYLGGCVPLNEAESKGLVLAISAGHATAEIIAALPTGASSARLRSANNQTTPLKQQQGTVAAVTSVPATLEYSVGNERFGLRVSPSATQPYMISAPKEK